MKYEYSPTLTQNLKVVHIDRERERERERERSKTRKKDKKENLKRSKRRKYGSRQNFLSRRIPRNLCEVKDRAPLLENK
jgi:hypothetical protein